MVINKAIRYGKDIKKSINVRIQIDAETGTSNTHKWEMAKKNSSEFHVSGTSCKNVNCVVVFKSRL